jgi:hypothetical protein
MNGTTVAFDPGVHTRLRWTAALAVLTAGVLATAELQGRSSRVLFRPQAELAARPVAVVGDAADAFRVWRAAGLRGRRLVVLSGQWSKPRNLESGAPTPEEMAAARAGGETEFVDARSALFAAAQLGIVRGLEVVMPPAAFESRLAEVSGRKGLERGDGTFDLGYEGFARRFSTPRAFVAPAEPVLVLVEPTWFAEGAPRDPLAWLSAAGVRFDLALVALTDPAAGEEERRAASSFTRAEGLPFLQAAE